MQNIDIPSPVVLGSQSILGYENLLETPTTSKLFEAGTETKNPVIPLLVSENQIVSDYFPLQGK